MEHRLLGIVAAYGVAIGIQEIIQSRKSVKDVDVTRIVKKLGRYKANCGKPLLGIEEDG